jgi:predicted dehydrogenase
VAVKETGEKLSFGILGCGQVVQELHLPAWSVVPNVELSSICDFSQAALEKVSERVPAARAFTSLDAFLDQLPGLSFVVLATPGITHPKLAQRILEKGIPLLCEKPLSLTSEDAHSICDAADRTGAMLTAIQNYRWKENTRRALGALRSGELGDIVAVNLKFRSGSLFDEAGPWRRHEQQNRTLLFESGIHFVDIAMLFLGALKSLQFVDADVDSLGLQRVVFGTLHEGGARGVFDLMVDASSTSTEMEVLGESRGLALQFFPQGYRRLPSRDTPLHRCVAEGRRLVDYARDMASDKLFRPKCSHRARSHAQLFTAFVSALRGHAPNPVPARELIPTIQLLDDVAQRSYQATPSHADRNGRVIEKAVSTE